MWHFASTSSSSIEFLTHCPVLRIVKCRLGHGAHSIDAKTSSLRACHFIGLHMKIKLLLYTVGTAWNYTDVITKKNNTTVYMTDTHNLTYWNSLATVISRLNFVSRSSSLAAASWPTLESSWWYLVACATARVVFHLPFLTAYRRPPSSFCPLECRGITSRTESFFFNLRVFIKE